MGRTVPFFLILFIFTVFIISACNKNGVTDNDPETVVELMGRLQVHGNRIFDEKGDTAAVRGMSLFWSQWGGNYYNAETVRWLRDDWKCTVIRAAIGVESGGYLENSQVELAKLYAVIDACIDLGIYVIVDWHDHHGEDHLDEAVGFFSAVASRYGNRDNLIYELYNEPLDLSWSEVLKPWAETVIAAIRDHDPDNLIVMGTPNWSQDVEEVRGHAIDDPNIAYSLHFYTSTHRQWLRNKADLALAADIPLFATEWGLSEASGTGDIDMTESALWMRYLEQNQLSWCNWSIIDKDESSAALLPTTTTLSGWSEEELTESGRIIRGYLIDQNGAVFEALD